MELASQLADAGFNLVINSRNVEKLQEVEKRIGANSAIEIKIVNADVSESEGIDQIIQATKGLDVG